MSKSQAESLYKGWMTKSRKRKMQGEAFEDGRFYNFLKNNDGFTDLIKGLVRIEMQLFGRRQQAEFAAQVWKLIDKFHRRVGELASIELMKAIHRNEGLREVVTAYLDDEKFEDDGPHLYTDPKVTRARILYKSLQRIHFKQTGISVTLERILGRGGMGGGVYLGKGSDGKDYAVKVFPGSYKASEFRGAVSGTKLKWRQQDILKKFMEADATTTCVDYAMIGCDQYLLLEMGQPLAWENLQTQDVVSAFRDLLSLEDYAHKNVNVHLTDKVGLLHLDIHGENLMRFDNKVRLIDFGQFLLYSTDFLARSATAQETDYHWGVSMRMIKEASNNDGGVWGGYLDNWRDHAHNIAYAQRARPQVGPVAYGNVVLTMVMIKEYWFAVSHALGFRCALLADDAVGNRPRWIVNTDVYARARAGLPAFAQRAPQHFQLVELLLDWYDHLMETLHDGGTISAKDAVEYFDPAGQRQVEPERRLSCFF